MGCDYYIYTNLKIVLKDGKQEYVEIFCEKRYYSNYYGNVDSDSESYDNAVEEDLEKQIEKHNSSKVLMENGEWKITRSSRINYYSELIKKKVENLEDVLDVSKVVSARAR